MPSSDEISIVYCLYNCSCVCAMNYGIQAQYYQCWWAVDGHNRNFIVTDEMMIGNLPIGFQLFEWC